MSLSNYQITSTIGTGYSGTIYKCHHIYTFRQYALKVIPRESKDVSSETSSSDTLQDNIKDKMLNEVTILSHLQPHPNILTLHNYYITPRHHHILTSYYPNGDLFDDIVRKRSTTLTHYTETEASTIIYTLLSTISYIHNHDIVHRDIKPENIMFTNISNYQSMKLIDFGLSTRYSPNSNKYMNTMAGTLRYMAPEVLTKQYTHTCDIWSVGVLLYILLCGYAPFDDGNDEHVISLISVGKVIFPHDEWKNVSEEAKDVIRWLLTMDGYNRPDAKDVSNHRWFIKNNCHGKTMKMRRRREWKQQRMVDCVNRQRIVV